MSQWQLYQLMIASGIVLALSWFIRRTLRLVEEGKKARFNALKSRRSSIRGQVQEKRARKQLQKMGFKIIKDHPTAEVGWWIDGVWTVTMITADYLVQRDGEVGLVEVKSGRTASTTHRKTRRQLLEYQHAFEVNAIFLYDAERSRLERIEFESIFSRQDLRKKPLSWLILGSFLGFFIGYYLSH